jgi:hypothetical protein
MTAIFMMSQSPHAATPAAEVALLIGNPILQTAVWLDRELADISVLPSVQSWIIQTRVGVETPDNLAARPDFGKLELSPVALTHNLSVVMPALCRAPTSCFGQAASKA